MLRPSFLLLASLFSVCSSAQIETQSTLAQQSGASGALQPLELADELVEYTELEYQLIEASGLLSLSQQVKSNAQRLIALSREQTEVNVSGANTATELTTEKKMVLINHAQHFAIAKNLAKNWTEEVWQQRLLELVHVIPEETQKLIQQQLSEPMLQASQRKEQAAINVQHSPEYRLYMNKLRQRPPSVARWQLVENLDKQSGFSSVIIQARLAVVKEIQLQVKDWQPAELWQNQARQEVLEFLFYAYRKTPNSELKHIAQSFNQPELQQFYADVRKTID
jgi:hypothetical protein